MKIFLLNPDPPFFRRGFVMRRKRVFPPITLAIIANSLEMSGHHVCLLDADALNMKHDRIIKEIGRFDPDLLIYNSDRHDGWQLPVPSNDYIRDFLDAYAREPGSTDEVLLIGPHPTLLPEVILNTIPSVKYLVRGEPENKTVEFVNALEKGDPRTAGGISYRGREGKLVHNPDPGFVQDLDALPLPAYHLLPMDLYKDNTAPDYRFGLVVTSRGCPMSCVFCSKSMYGAEFRTRSIEKVLEEIHILVRRYQVNRIFFHDQILLFKRDRIEELLNAMIKRRYNLSWRCQTRLSNLDEEVMKLMRASGCTEVHVGLESTSASVAKAVKKGGAGKNRFLEIHKIGADLGISISPNMIIGLPEDTRESVMESARFYNSMGFEFLLNVAIPYPDTELYKIGVREGKILSGDWESIVNAAGTPGNALTAEELQDTLKEIDEMNKSLRRSGLTLKQKLIKAPGYLVKKVVGKVAGK